MAWQPEASDDFLTPAEVAVIFFVDPKTVTRWAKAGKLDSVRTPGGHRRFLKSDVLALLAGVREHHPSLVLSTQRTVERGRGSASSLGPDVRLTFPDEPHPPEQGASAGRAPRDAAAVVVAAAEKTADAAARARVARALAAAEAARLVADDAARAAAVMQSRARTSATQDVEAAAEEVAAGVAAAAARMAKVVTAADIAFENEVEAAAQELRDLAATPSHVPSPAIPTTPDRDGYALW